MVNTYTGTPGSGKSLHCAQIILQEIRRKKRVICNFPINTDYISPKYRNNFYYVPDSELTPHWLFEFAKAYHKKKGEDQTLLVIDEAQRLFPIDRVYERRKEWEQFFQLHRHYGFTIILVTQNISYINKGIRIQTEYEVKHRKVNNYGIGGLILTLLHIPLFVSLTFWQGTRERIYSSFFLFRRKFNKLYDSYSNFDTAFAAVPAIEQREEEVVENETDEEEQEEIDYDGADFDEENLESWANDCNLTLEQLKDWRTA